MSATVTRVPDEQMTPEQYAMRAAHAEYVRHLDSGCERCSVPTWCADLEALDFAADVATRRAYGNP